MYYKKYNYKFPPALERVPVLQEQKVGHKTSDSPSFVLHDMAAEDTSHIEGKRSMWRAVITQAIVDAVNKSKKTVDKVARVQAISWLNGTTEDFMTVCALADMSPRYVIEKSCQGIREKDRWRRS